MLACDLVVASTQASFGLPEVKRSLLAFAGGVFRSPKVLPPNIAMELALTGDPITADRAYSLGLVNRLVEPGRALDAALELASRIKSNPPVAVRETRKVVRSVAYDNEDTYLSWARAASRVLEQTEDYKEGPRAFAEKRPPRWVGR